MKKKKINLIFFGAGSIIKSHIIASSKIGLFNLYGIFSRTFSKAKIIKDDYNIHHHFKKIKDIKLPKNEINVAVVGVSIENTFKIFKKIYQKFDICLLEKPAGYNYAEAKKMYNLSKLSETKFFVCLNRRYYSSTKSLKNFLTKDRSSRLLNIIDTEIPSLLRSKYNNKVISNWVYANSIHLIDYIIFICRGKLKSMRTIYSKDKKLRVFLLEFTTGDICNYTQIWDRPGPWSISVSTSKRFYKLEPLEQLTYRDHSSYKFHRVKTNLNDKNYKPGFIEMYKNLFLYLNNKKNDLVSLKDSLVLMKLISKLNKVNQ